MTTNETTPSERTGQSLTNTLLQQLLPSSTPIFNFHGWLSVTYTASEQLHKKLKEDIDKVNAVAGVVVKGLRYDIHDVPECVRELEAKRSQAETKLIERAKQMKLKRKLGEELSYGIVAGHYWDGSEPIVFEYTIFVEG